MGLEFRRVLFRSGFIRVQRPGGEMRVHRNLKRISEQFGGESRHRRVLEIIDANTFNASADTPHSNMVGTAAQQYRAELSARKRVIQVFRKRFVTVHSVAHRKTDELLQGGDQLFSPDFPEG